MSTGTREHIVRSYDAELTRLTGEIVSMGASAGMQLDRAMQALAARDDVAAQQVIAADDALDAQERRISADVLRLLALRQPFASDLREVLAALRIAADIERIGDYAANIARRSLVLNQSAPVPLVTGLPALAHLAGDMLRDVLEAYQAHDAQAARMVWERDDVLDRRYGGLFRELLTYMMEDPYSISACSHLLFIAKHLERIGDHATNVAENVWFAACGSALTTHEGRHAHGVRIDRA